jgi:predicted  nucleic acid-binding Zn-ribbon protein
MENFNMRELLDRLNENDRRIEDNIKESDFGPGERGEPDLETDDDERYAKCINCGHLNDRDDMRGDSSCEECGKDVFDYEEEEDTFESEGTIREGVSKEELQDGIEEVQMIQEEFYELIERLDSAIRAYAPEQHAYWNSYGLAHLKIIVGSEQYAAGDRSINDLIEYMQDELSGEEDDAFGEGKYDELDDMKSRSEKQSGDLAGLRDKLDSIKARRDSDEPGYDDRSIRGVKRTRRR